MAHEASGCLLNIFTVREQKKKDLIGLPSQWGCTFSNEWSS